MKPAKTAFFIILILIAQTLIFSRLEIFNGRIDLLLIFTILSGVFVSPIDGLFIGIISGFFVDILTFPFYMHVLSYGMAGFLSGILQQNIFKDDDIILFLLVFSGSLMTYIFEVFILGQFFDTTISNIPRIIFVSSLLNMSPTLFIRKAVRSLAA